MRILIAGQSNYISHNGQSIFTKNLAEGLAKQGHEVMLLLPSERKHAYREVHQGVIIQTMTSVNLRFWHPDIYLALYPPPTIEKVFHEFNPEIVHIQDHYPLSWFVYLAASRYKVRIIGTNHFMPENMAPHAGPLMISKPLFNKVMWWFMTTLYNRLDYVTAPSQTALSILRRVGLVSNGSPISCGVDMDHFQPVDNLNKAAFRRQFSLDPECKLFLFVGRVDGEKRLDVLLHALAILDRSDVQLAIAGVGTDTDNLTKLTQKLNLNNRVHFLGFVPDEQLPSLLTSADVFAMPSEAELLSIATLEAMGCEKPLLAARAGALPELVNVGENGYLFTAGDPESAAHFMAKLADHPERWEIMGKASRKKATPHHITNIIQAYEKIYENTRSKKSPQVFTHRAKADRELEKIG